MLSPLLMFRERSANGLEILVLFLFKEGAEFLARAEDKGALGKKDACSRDGSVDGERITIFRQEFDQIILHGRRTARIFTGAVVVIEGMYDRLTHLFTVGAADAVSDTQGHEEDCVHDGKQENQTKYADCE